MASWSEIETAEPRIARAARERLDAGVHKTIATLRADGSPRISGIEGFYAPRSSSSASTTRATDS